MLKIKLAKPMLVALAACAASVAFNGIVFADDAQTKALQDQMKAMQQQMQEMQKKLDALTKQQTAPPPVVQPVPVAPPPAGTGPAVAKEAPKEPKFEKFLSGFYGTLDVSFDDTTKGIEGLVAHHYALIDPANPNSGYQIDPANPNPKSGPVGRVGYMPAFSTNKSVIGYRGSHKIDGGETEFIYQIEVQPSITSSPGLNTSQYQQSNVVKGAIGYGDTFVGFADPGWGKIKVGTTYSPYKKSTDRMNPFSGELGDYAVVMGNSGGDNRVEFGTRLEHAIWYESPKFGGVFSFDALVSPGQNRTYNNVVQSSGSPDCNGGNQPGSGNLLLNCDDGGFGDAYSVDVKFETGPFYATVAYEMHKGVNRNSDGIGSNHPIYGYLVGINSPLLDFATYNFLVSQYPGVAANDGFSPPYLTDIADESAFKVGAQYTFGFGLSVSGIYEYLKRDLPADLKFQNERQRNGIWFALSQDLWSKDNVSVGWAHAGATPGDPGGQHNYNPLSTDNTANMYTVAWKHRFDKSLTWYLDAAETINNGNAHYDIGAGGRGLTTDCHDGTNTTVIDYSSAGNTTWGGCHEVGFSTGVNYKF
ncbi:MAG TPA: porin [Steroidobacteraceae bacterium]|jgi:predicted porin|nr:porin [Steroidobacteraceae bacterium]